jgi:hypothetical protein
MDTKQKFLIPILILITFFLAACDTQMKFTAPETDPPADLIPSYVPEGFNLVSGFQLSAEFIMPEFTGGDEIGLNGRLLNGDHFLGIKSPAGDVIQGVYYQGKQYLILITKSNFPNGTIDDWLALNEERQFKPCDCDCAGFVRLGELTFPTRFEEPQEERTIDGTRVAIFKGPLGWLTVFVRGEYLLTVESEISLEENLKIVTSLINM